MIRLNGSAQPGREYRHQVTYSEKNAAYSDRVIHLLDGWMNDEEKSAIPVKNPAAGKRRKNHSEAT